MSISLNFWCPVCKEVFKTVDTIYSTSCGHIFHFSCLNNWKSRSSSYPQCRDYNPTYHRIYVNFDEEDSAEKESLSKQLEDIKLKYQALRRIAEKSREVYVNKEKRILALNECLKKENTSKEESIKTLSEENSELLKIIDSLKKATPESAVKEENRIVEHKLEIITSEFRKEVSKNIQLTADNMKLQNYVDQMESIKKDKINNAKKKNKKNKNSNGINAELGLVIKNYPNENIIQPLENIIILIASKMDIFILKEDIKKVINKNKQLYVEFKSRETKLQFIAQQEKLKNNPTTECITFEEYFGGNIQALFSYANKKLRGKIFDYIAIKGNSIVAKKKLEDVDTVHIRSHAQVNEMLQSVQVPKIYNLML
ncbi:uncharacterized protein LOC142228257 [Haematobia irritans]|uniref:uncharacterized protein LOC142228257 n=1 Tax=Haematobia irritans TaxID=7368 RepID=UPI003F502335